MQRIPYALPNGEIVYVRLDDGELPKAAIAYQRDGKLLAAVRVDSLRSWHFGATADIVIVNDATTLTVDYDIGAGRRTGGAQFRHVDGPALDGDTLDELADDMVRLAGSQFGPISPRFYRRAA